LAKTGFSMLYLSKPKTGKRKTTKTYYHIKPQWKALRKSFCFFFQKEENLFSFCIVNFKIKNIFV